MSERSPEAIAAALAMLRDPQLARLAQRSPLPKGMTFLIEAAAGEGEVLATARAMTGRSEETLQKAAGFFIEQVLLSRHGDNYRILGASCAAPAAELRRHMALILRWLHPDLYQGAAEGKGFNRSAYVNLVTEAWETLKTPDRRAAYDSLLAERKSNSGKRNGSFNGKAARAERAAAGSGPRSAHKSTGGRPVLYRIERDSFFSRLLFYLGILR